MASPPSPRASRAPRSPGAKAIHPPVAHKFGGSSLADAARINGVARLLLARPEHRQAVVVSAMRGVTDELIGLARLAGSAGTWRSAWEDLRKRHRATATGLAGRDPVLAEALEREFMRLYDVLHAIALLGAPGEDALQWVQGLGEVCSSHLLAAAFRAAGAKVDLLDARQVLTVRHGPLGPVVDWEDSRRRLQDWQRRHEAPRVVVTGFVARLPDGRATTLGRNGSDHSGAIFAALFEASELHIWTDVDGVYSADPRRVPEARRLDALSYDEACELAYFGAKVIHPRTLGPLIEHAIPMRLRSTFTPVDPGTRVDATRSLAPPVKGLSVVDGLALVTLEGAGLIGVPGTAERVFGALHRTGVSVRMISQGSSEHSICCLVEADEAEAAVAALQQAFALELAGGQVQRVLAEPGISVLAAVGEGMAGTPGIAARLFAALARAGVNIRAIAQGASERNISAAIASSDAARALRAAHAGFYLSAQSISVGVIGPGNVGAAVLDQIGAAAARLREASGLDLRVRAVAGSRRMLLHEAGLNGDWRARYAEAADATELDAFAAHVRAEPWPQAVIIDCSASDAVAARYPDWLAAGIHVITPNKRAGAGPYARYAAIASARRDGAARFRYEATVGAGLPVISTLRDLVDSGDTVLQLDCVLSGTLAWLFNRFDGSRPFSELVAEARALGYTEPDPREDLSGLDVARKLVILAREMGLAIELADVSVESLVPEALREGDVEAFVAGAGAMDAPLAERLARARAEGKVLRHVARLDAEGRASVAVQALPGDHPFAHLRLTDNIVQFTTQRYRDNPLIVQGPGAGPDVTAAGVFSDLLRLGAAAGARL